jgi:hypothetical protein
MEQLLHYVWQHKIFPLKTLTTTTGQTVEVIDSGLHNSNAGPDFFNAKLKIGGTMWIGNVEIHMRASDWIRHGHNNDPAYDNVILHVVETADQPTHRTTGEVIPQMELQCPDYVRDNYHALARADFSPACHGIIGGLLKLTIHSWMTSLQIERLEHKTASIMNILKQLDNDWEACFFTLMARYMGVGLNGDAFEAWAKRLDLHAADKMRDDVCRIEALFLGSAGLLSDAPQDGYSEQLCREYAYQRHLYNLPEPMESSRWKLFRTRPDNFPFVRMAQMAQLFCSKRGLFSQMIEADSISTLLKLFECSASGYWDTHYQPGREAPSRTKALGLSVRNILVINAAIPMMYAYGTYRGADHLCDKAISLLEEMKAESNYITRQWDAAGIESHSAADSQALIELTREYCEKRKCLHCRFGYEFMRSRSR